MSLLFGEKKTIVFKMSKILETGIPSIFTPCWYWPISYHLTVSEKSVAQTRCSQSRSLGVKLSSLKKHENKKMDRNKSFPGFPHAGIAEYPKHSSEYL